MENDEIYNLPDWQFAKWCEKTFSINRGVYNTIDEKLFELGYNNIHVRRKTIIAFLQQHVKGTNHKFYKFGPGKLSVALHNFHSQIILSK